MTFFGDVIKGYMRGIHIAYLVLQLLITLVVLLITSYIVYEFGKPDEYFHIAINVLAVLTIIIFGSKISFQMYENYKGNK